MMKDGTIGAWQAPELGIRNMWLSGEEQYPLGGYSVSGKSESTNSGATKPVPFFTNERTNYAALAKVVHEKQWTVAVISWSTFLVHQPALLHPIESHRNTNEDEPNSLAMYK